MACCHHLPTRRLFIDRLSIIQANHRYWFTRQLTTLQQTAKHSQTVRSVFGIVAAITNEGVIGINGKLPWHATPISIDRDHFVNLTRNKILIIGRKTFANEDPTGSHIRHVRVCIVVSKTMEQIDSSTNAYIKDDEEFPVVRLARSFKDALEMVSEYVEDDIQFRGDRIDGNHDVIMTDKIQCWVAGGENIYREALRHDNAVEAHLTHVNMSIDTTTKCEVVYFPMASLKEHGFQETSRRDIEICSFCMYTKSSQKKT